MAPPPHYAAGSTYPGRSAPAPAYPPAAPGEKAAAPRRKSWYDAGLWAVAGLAVVLVIASVVIVVLLVRELDDEKAKGQSDPAALFCVFHVFLFYWQFWWRETSQCLRTLWIQGQCGKTTSVWVTVQWRTSKLNGVKHPRVEATINRLLTNKTAERVTAARIVCVCVCVCVWMCVWRGVENVCLKRKFGGGASLHERVPDPQRPLDQSERSCCFPLQRRS